MFRSLFTGGLWGVFFSLVIIFAAWVMPNIANVSERERHIVKSIRKVSLFVLLVSAAAVMTAFLLEI